MTVIFDYLRHQRIGLPESVYCEGKHVDSIGRLIAELAENAAHPVLFTRLVRAQLDLLDRSLVGMLDYHELSATAYLNGVFPETDRGSVAIVAAGTSDLRVALEAGRTLGYLGIPNEVYADVGVAGLWRLQERIANINAHDVVIVVAGMDAALASVVGGMTPRPVIAVPTSVGYGVAQGGATALNSMLASCASGLLVTNIDNGYGAACAAFRIISNRYRLENAE
jgi:NCAIR mutase (PurE)-related protein